MSKPVIKFLSLCIRALSAAKRRLSLPRKNSPEYIQGQRVRRWFSDKGDETLRLNYPLNSRSTVFDVGGYRGEFAASIICKYDCTVYIFEPVPEFFRIIAEKFSANANVKYYCFGLSDRTSSQKISMTDNSSSLFIKDANAVNINLKSAVEFLQENNIDCIDLLKINIEGSEYALLESILEHNLISRFKNIQVQFHDFIIEHARLRMEKIQQQLSKTHELTYQYDFVWENWKLKE